LLVETRLGSHTIKRVLCFSGIKVARTSPVNGCQYIAVYTGDGQLTGGVAAYNKQITSARRVNTIQVFALPEEVAKQTPLLPAAAVTKAAPKGKAK
jgi:hypothetical protein